MPILSIITVNLNNKRGLQRTIDSVINQTFTDSEWIVIDGGSTDGSKEIIEQYKDYFSFWCSESDNGIYNAMNKGIQHAKGEWLLFLNSGDWFFDNDTLKEVFSIERNNDVMYGNAYVTDLINQELWVYPAKLTPAFMWDNSLCHQATFFRSIIFVNHKYDESFQIISDWIVEWQLLLENKRFEHINIAIAYFDKTGMSSECGSLVQQERERARFQYTPSFLYEPLSEYIRLQSKWDYLNSLKSLKIMTHWFFKISHKWLDFVTWLKEKSRKKKK